MEIKLICTRQVIRVRMMRNRRCLYGTVIGTSDGVVGVLMDTGEYIDVPEEKLWRCETCCIPEKKTDGKSRECRPDSRHCTRKKKNR